VDPSSRRAPSTRPANGLLETERSFEQGNRPFLDALMAVIDADGNGMLDVDKPPPIAVHPVTPAPQTDPGTPAGSDTPVKPGSPDGNW
jgi:hypothetical protein